MDGSGDLHVIQVILCFSDPPFPTIADAHAHEHHDKNVANLLSSPTISAIFACIYLRFILLLSILSLPHPSHVPHPLSLTFDACSPVASLKRFDNTLSFHYGQQYVTDQSRLIAGIIA